MKPNVTSMMRAKSWILVSMLVCTLGSMTAQEAINPTVIERTVLQGQTVTIELHSNRPLTILSQQNLSNSTVSVDAGNGINLTSNFVYTAGADFEGWSLFMVDYASLDGIGYSHIRIKVVPSLLAAKDDFGIVEAGQSIQLDVLANDIQGHGITQLVGIDAPSIGNSAISAGQVVYTAPDGFSGEVHFTYFTQDATGYKASGVVSILVKGAAMAGQTLYYTTDNRNPVNILLDDASYQLVSGAQMALGTLDDLGVAKVFIPHPIATGIQPLQFINASGEVVRVEVTVLSSNTNTGVAVADRIYTSRNSVVSFDPRANDIRRDAPIVAHSAELSLAEGILSYQPPAGFSGVKTFSYTILDGLTSYSADIEIFIGDYLPTKTSYNFSTQRGTPLVLDYQVPIFNYSWSIISQPRRGKLNVNLDAFLPTDQCNAAYGYRMMVYEPNVNFVGADNFTIQYCTAANSCRQVEINIQVIQGVDDCGCVGRDCVWSGDTDNDGMVSVLDLLPIGLYYGEGGHDRTDISDNWIAQQSDDWAYEQLSSGVNLKYVDTNGDGVINAADTIALHQYYDQYHNLTPQLVVAQKEEAIRFVPRETSYQAGDLAEFDIVVGSESHPAKDLHGIAFSFQLPAHLVDASTLRFQFEPSEWFGQGSPVISMYHIRGTTVEASIVRTNGRGISGIGSIGSTGIVITIDLDGLRPEDKVLPFEIKLGAAHATSGNGGLYALPAVTEATEVVLGGHDEQAINTTPTIVLYPNPAVRQLQIHANGGDELIDIDIYSLSGMRVYTKRGIHQQGFVIDTHLPTGMYAAHIVSANGYSVHKVQIVAE